MEEKGTAVREGGLLAPGNAGADGDGADRRADVMPAGPGDRPATLGGRPGKRSPVPAADGYDSDFSLTGLPSAVATSDASSVNSLAEMTTGSSSGAESTSMTTTTLDDADGAGMPCTATKNTAGTAEVSVEAGGGNPFSGKTEVGLLFTPAAVAGAGDGAAAAARGTSRADPIRARQVEEEVGSGGQLGFPGNRGDARHRTVPPPPGFGDTNTAKLVSGGGAMQDLHMSEGIVSAEPIWKNASGLMSMAGGGMGAGTSVADDSGGDTQQADGKTMAAMMGAAATHDGETKGDGPGNSRPATQRRRVQYVLTRPLSAALASGRSDTSPSYPRPRSRPGLTQVTFNENPETATSKIATKIRTNPNRALLSLSQAAQCIDHQAKRSPFWDAVAATPVPEHHSPDEAPVGPPPPMGETLTKHVVTTTIDLDAGVPPYYEDDGTRRLRRTFQWNVRREPRGTTTEGGRLVGSEYQPAADGATRRVMKDMVVGQLAKASPLQARDRWVVTEAMSKLLISSWKSAVPWRPEPEEQEAYPPFQVADETDRRSRLDASQAGYHHLSLSKRRVEKDRRTFDPARWTALQIKREKQRRSGRTRRYDGPKRSVSQHMGMLLSLYGECNRKTLARIGELFDHMKWGLKVRTRTLRSLEAYKSTDATMRARVHNLYEDISRRMDEFHEDALRKLYPPRNGEAAAQPELRDYRWHLGQFWTRLHNGEHGAEYFPEPKEKKAEQKQPDATSVNQFEARGEYLRGILSCEGSTESKMRMVADGCSRAQDRSRTDVDADFAKRYAELLNGGAGSRPAVLSDTEARLFSISPSQLEWTGTPDNGKPRTIFLYEGQGGEQSLLHDTIPHPLYKHAIVSPTSAGALVWAHEIVPKITFGSHRYHCHRLEARAAGLRLLCMGTLGRSPGRGTLGFPDGSNPMPGLRPRSIEEKLLGAIRQGGEPLCWAARRQYNSVFSFTSALENEQLFALVRQRPLRANEGGACRFALELGRKEAQHFRRLRLHHPVDAAPSVLRQLQKTPRLLEEISQQVHQQQLRQALQDVPAPGSGIVMKGAAVRAATGHNTRASQYKGVYGIEWPAKQSTRWYARETHSRRGGYIGSFSTEKEAALAYDARLRSRGAWPVGRSKYFNFPRVDAGERSVKSDPRRRGKTPEGGGCKAAQAPQQKRRKIGEHQATAPTNAGGGARSTNTLRVCTRCRRRGHNARSCLRLDGRHPE